jgi:Uma2 family endonuclease
MIARIEPTQESVLLENLEDEHLYEIIDGQRVELPPTCILASRVTNNILGHMFHYLLGNPVGLALMETLFRLPLPVDRNRRPDVAFISAKTIAETPAQPGSDNAWAILPDLMVEAVSPHDIAEEIIDKISEYFSAGTKLVWVVYPTQRLIYVYESPRQVRILCETDELDGGVVLPGFRIRLGALFPG